MNDMSAVIQPKSDQLNADSLQAGPLKIEITGVTIKPGEQPITVSFKGDDGKPWKPCKSMARVLVAAWGPDASKYAGRSLVLYRDASVTWGGMAVGGIRVSHMSDIDGKLTLALTATRGNKKPFTVQPLKSEPASSEPAFDFDSFESAVTSALSDPECDITSWWESMKPTRMQAGKSDRERAIKIAERVTAAISA